ncbi:MAG: ABC transporter ATP-binding protein, partial [Clostridiales bacterium]|nr:ABC transporter ATP-binding protein [Clostridiales bacterium]
RKFLSFPYPFASKNPKKNRARVHVDDSEIGRFISDISTLNVEDFHEFSFTLEDYFMKFYKEDKVFEGVKQ